MSGFDVFTSRLIVQGQLVLLTPLRIGTGSSSDVTGSKNPVIKDIDSKPIIPGSSLKGAMRAHLEALFQAFQESTDQEYNLVCNVLSSGATKQEDMLQASCLKDLAPALSDPENRQMSKSELDRKVVKKSCRICKLFGSPWIGGRLFLRDLNVSLWSRTYLFRDGVAIDRDTGTAADKRKYDFEAVPAGTQFEFIMQLDNADDVDLAIALLAVQALEKGQIQLGGGRSRGTGWCKLIQEEMSYQLYEDALDLLLGRMPTQLDQDAIAGRIASFADWIGS